MDRGAWWAAVQGVIKSWTLLSTHTHTHKDIFLIATSIIPAINQDSENGVEGRGASKGRQVLRQVFEQHDCWKAN